MVVDLPLHQGILRVALTCVSLATALEGNNVAMVSEVEADGEHIYGGGVACSGSKESSTYRGE